MTYEARVELENEEGNKQWYEAVIHEMYINDRVTGPDPTFELQLANHNNFDHVTEGDELLIQMRKSSDDPWETIYGGIIQKVLDEFGEDGRLKTLKGKSYIEVLNQEVSKAFLNRNVSKIVEDLVLPRTDDITLDLDLPSESFEEIIFQNMTIKEAIKKLVKFLKGKYIIYIDYNKTLHVEPEGKEKISDTIEEGKNIMWSRIGNDTSRLVNFVYLYGESRSTKRTISTTATGSEQTIGTLYMPKNVEVYNKTKDNYLSGGLINVNSLEDADTDFLVNRLGMEITISAQTENDELEITYSRSHPVFATRRNTTSINNYGRNEFYKTEDVLENQEMAQKLADRIIEEFSEPLKIAEVEITGVIGMKAGKSVDIITGKHDETLTIEEVNYEWSEDGFTQSLTLNERLGDLNDLVENHELRIKRIEGELTGVLEVIPQQIFPDDAVSLGESYTIEIRDAEGEPSLKRTIIGSESLYYKYDDGEGEPGFNRGTYDGIVTGVDQLYLKNGVSEGTWTVFQKRQPIGENNNPWKDVAISGSTENTDVEVLDSEMNLLYTNPDTLDDKDELWDKDLYFRIRIKDSGDYVGSVNIIWTAHKLGDDPGIFEEVYSS